MQVDDTIRLPTFDEALLNTDTAGGNLQCVPSVCGLSNGV